MSSRSAAARVRPYAAAVPSREATEAKSVRKSSAGSRNRVKAEVVQLDCVTAIRDHCAVYTGPEAVEVLLDLVGWSAVAITGDSRLLEPACGDGSFLLPAIDRLLDWARTRPEADIEPMIRAYEFDLGTVDALRTAIVARLAKRGGCSGNRATSLASAWVRCDDFLLAEPDFAATHVVGNPPYMRWSLVPSALRSSYEDALPKAAARGDLCLAFLWRATRFAIAPGSRIGFLCADRWLRCAYGRDVRAELATSHALTTHIEVHGLPVFKGARKVGAYAAITVLERGAIETATRFATAGSIADLRRLASARPPKKRGAASVWPSRKDDGARLASGPVRELLDTIEWNSRPLSEAGVSVRCGTALGHAKAFVVPAGANIEPERLLPYLRSSDVGRDGGISPSAQVIDVWTDEGELIDLRLAPKLARHLRKFREDLEARACVVGKDDWYRTIDKIHADRIAEAKVIVAGMSRRAKIAYDPGGHVASNALYCLVSGRWPLEALTSALRAGILDIFGEVLSPRFSGGTRRFDGNVLRQVRLPVWNALSDALRRRVEARGLGDGFDPSLISDLFHLRSTGRRTLETLLSALDLPVDADGDEA